MATYLNNSENWIFRLLANLPDVQVSIAAKTFLRNSPYPASFTFVEFPIRPIEHRTRTFAVRAFNRVAHEALIYYPRYAGAMSTKLDIIHSHFAPTGWDYLPTAKSLRVPHVVSFYGYDYRCLPLTSRAWGKRYALLFAQVDAVLCEGPYGGTTLRQMGCPEEKIKIAHLGVNVGSIPFVLREKRPSDLKLLQIANLAEKKGHIRTVQSFIRALERCPNMSLTLVGRDIKGKRSELEAIISGTDAASRVTFIDEIDFRTLHHFMLDYHVFIHPSCHVANGDCEGGAPVVLLDAQATGMPVISTTHCDIPSEVANGVTGLLSQENETEALAESIVEFYRMGAQRYGEFAVAARRHIECHYEVGACARAVRSVYNQVIRSKNSAPQ